MILFLMVVNVIFSFVSIIDELNLLVVVVWIEVFENFFYEDVIGL